MIVNAASFPAPAFWQGMMFIGLAIWAPWLFSIPYYKKPTAPYVFIALWTLGVSFLTYKMFG